MKKIDKRIKVGTKVKLFGSDNLRMVNEIHETRNWIKCLGYSGFYQVGHIEYFRNDNKKQDKLNHKTQIIGRRWFDKKWGNTYHSVEVYIDNELLERVEFEYGYDDQYRDTAYKLLKKHNIDIGSTYNEWARHKNTLFTVTDVTRKKDL